MNCYYDCQRRHLYSEECGCLFCRENIIEADIELPPLSRSSNMLEVGDSYEQRLLVSTCSKQWLHFLSRRAP